MTHQYRKILKIADGQNSDIGLNTTTKLMLACRGFLRRLSDIAGEMGSVRRSITMSWTWRVVNLLCVPEVLAGFVLMLPRIVSVVFTGLALGTIA